MIILADDTTLSTCGAGDDVPGQPEIVLEVRSEHLVETGKHLLQRVIDSAQEAGEPHLADEILACGMAMVTFVPGEEEDTLELRSINIFEEREVGEDGFEATTILYQQLKICEEYTITEPAEVHPALLCTVYPGWDDQTPLTAVRHLPSNNHSGWEMRPRSSTPNPLHGQVITLYQLMQQRLDIVPFLLMPPGWTVQQGQDPDKDLYDQEHDQQHAFSLDDLMGVMHERRDDAFRCVYHAEQAVALETPDPNVWRHSHPLHGEQANMVVSVPIAYNDDGQVQWEQLHARRTNGLLFEICCVPFYATGVACGDIVETDEHLVVRSRRFPNGHDVIRVEMFDDDIERSLIELLQQEQLSWEWVNQTVLVVDVPDVRTGKDILAVLRNLESLYPKLVSVDNMTDIPEHSLRHFWKESFGVVLFSAAIVLLANILAGASPATTLLAAAVTGLMTTVCGWSLTVVSRWEQQHLWVARLRQMLTCLLALETVVAASLLPTDTYLLGQAPGVWMVRAAAVVLIGSVILFYRQYRAAHQPDTRILPGTPPVAPYSYMWVPSTNLRPQVAIMRNDETYLIHADSGFDSTPYQTLGAALQHAESTWDIQADEWSYKK